LVDEWLQRDNSTMGMKGSDLTAPPASLSFKRVQVESIAATIMRPTGRPLIRAPTSEPPVRNMTSISFTKTTKTRR
jgi:hypothetical protein